MDGRDVRLHLRNQEHIERELCRIADALEKLVKLREKEQKGVLVGGYATEIETTIDIQKEDENND